MLTTGPASKIHFAQKSEQIRSVDRIPDHNASQTEKVKSVLFQHKSRITENQTDQQLVLSCRLKLLGTKIRGETVKVVLFLIMANNTSAITSTTSLPTVQEQEPRNLAEIYGSFLECDGNYHTGKPFQDVYSTIFVIAWVQLVPGIKIISSRAEGSAQQLNSKVPKEG